MNIALLTSISLRHKACAKIFSTNPLINSITVYFEQPRNKTLNNNKNEIISTHLEHRNTSEEDIFSDLLTLNDRANTSYKIVEWGFFSTLDFRKEAAKKSFDLICVYGSSIIRGEIIKDYNYRFLNLHLGLSPFYRGAGTNYFPFVNKEPQYAGFSIIYLDDGIDTGEVIHQGRPMINEHDSFQQLSCRFLKQSFYEYVNIATNIKKLKTPKPSSLKICKTRKIYKQKDFTQESCKRLYKNFSEGLLSNYLKNKKELDELVPILTQDIFL